MPATNTLDLSGNTVVVSNLKINSDTPFQTAATQPSVLAGSGAPTLTANKGSIYTNVTASTTTTRVYVNTDGAATWASFTASA